MVKEELACLYRTYRTEYLKVVCFLLALTLGPWLGVQVLFLKMGLVQPGFWVPNVALCATFFAQTLLLLSLTERQCLQWLWIVGAGVCVMGHWLVLLVWEKGDRPESKLGEMMPFYCGVTLVMVMLLILPVCDLVTTVCCGEGGRRTGTGSDISGEEGTGGPQELQPFNRPNNGGAIRAEDASHSQNGETTVKRPLS